MNASSEHLETAFRRAAAVADEAVGLWLAGNSKQSTPVDDKTRPAMISSLFARLPVRLRRPTHDS